LKTFRRNWNCLLNIHINSLANLKSVLRATCACNTSHAVPTTCTQTLSEWVQSLLTSFQRQKLTSWFSISFFNYFWLI
jgi:hypothetical protein